MKTKQAFIIYFILVLLSIIFCSIYATTIPKTSPIIQNVQRAIHRTNVSDTIDVDIVEFWEFLRTRVEKQTLTILKNENRLLHSALLSKLNNILNLAEDIGPRQKSCKDVIFETSLADDIGDSIDVMCIKLNNMKADTEKCQKLGGVDENLLKRRLVSRCLRKNTSKHRWELVPAVNTVAQFYTKLESLEAVMESCRNFLSESTT